MEQVPEIFYKSIRDLAKAPAKNLYTREYMRRLERIAKAAWDFRNCTELKPGDMAQSRSEHELYDALFAVDFMGEEN